MYAVDGVDCKYLPPYYITLLMKSKNRTSYMRLFSIVIGANKCRYKAKCL